MNAATRFGEHTINLLGLTEPFIFWMLGRTGSLMVALVKWLTNKQYLRYGKKSQQPLAALL
jgi:hypothetical protein